MNIFLLALFKSLLFASLAPLLNGTLKSIKAKLQNRKGPSIVQPYRDLYKLFRKEMVIPQNASLIFKITPVIVFSVTLIISTTIPVLSIGYQTSPIADVIVIIGLFALIRFFLTLAGMDIGTSFGGMGSSREMMVSALAEPALLLAFFAFAMNASSTNLSFIIYYLLNNSALLHPSIIFAGFGFVLIAIAETGRIPVDNPATHLELTMIHEAMILEYSGKNLALIEWASQIKFMLYCVLFCDLFFPWGIAKNLQLQNIMPSFFILIVKLLILCFSLAIAETNLAKLRIFRVPYLLGLAFFLCLIGVLSHIILEVS